MHTGKRQNFRQQHSRLKAYGSIWGAAFTDAAHSSCVILVVHSSLSSKTILEQRDIFTKRPDSGQRERRQDPHLETYERYLRLLRVFEGKKEIH